ncbi:unnamed protein product, partial [marine sediment metagenome]
FDPRNNSYQLRQQVSERNFWSKRGGEAGRGTPKR